MTPRGSVAVLSTHAATDAELLQQLDELVADAARGNGQAIGAIAIAFGSTLYAEIREALGDALRRDAADILQDFLVSLAEARLHFPRVRGSALPWMKRMVRSIAVEHRRQRSADTGRPA
jgi:DNA-directed RNA polymerase specialized sigma24 family protein